MNTANKRASAIGIGLAIRLVLPIPDSTIDQADRQQVAYSYAGIPAASPIPIPETTRARNVRVTAASEAVDIQVSAASVALDVAISPASAAVDVSVTPVSPALGLKVTQPAGGKAPKVS